MNASTRGCPPGDTDGARGEVDIAVLGPVAVRGAAEPFRRAAALELVVYLAFHRDGVRQGACASALWPERTVSPATVHSTASDARRALGHAPDGVAHLSRGAELRLRQTVTTDVERFSVLAASGGPDDLVRAMELVRGPVFTGLSRADWAVFDGTASEVERLVVRTALRGAAELARCGAPGLAEWVVRRALALSPYDERLYRALLRATAAQGDRVRLRATMAELCTLAGEPTGPTPVRAPEGPWPGGRRSRTRALELGVALHPRTRDLYRDLLQVAPGTGGHPARL